MLHTLSSSIALLFFLTTASTAQAQAFVAVGSSPFGPPPEPAYEDFGRRVTLPLVYRTGIRTSFEDFICSDVDVDDAVLTAVYPAGTSFVGESDGGGVVDAANRTVTWSLGTLDAFGICFGATIDLTLDVDAAIPDGDILSLDLSISTSTAGDDPADNQLSVPFGVGYLPVEIWFTASQGSCREDLSPAPGGGTPTLQTCGAVNAVVLGPPLFPPVLLGALTIDAGGLPQDVVRSPLVSVIAAARTGGGQLDSEIETDFEVRNPNPYPVELNVRRYTVTRCQVDGGTAIADASDASAVLTSGSVPFGEEAECGFGNVDTMREELSTVFRAEAGVSPGCTVETFGFSDERGVIDESDSTQACVFQATPSAGTLPLTIDLETLDVEPPTESASSHYASARAQWTFALAGSSLGRFAGAILVSAQSPVDVLVRGPSGLLTGVLDVPEAGRTSLAEIPGSISDPPEAEPEESLLGLPEPGIYGLQVVGTGDGPYQVVLQTFDEAGALIDTLSYQGTAAAQSRRVEYFVLAEDGDLEVPEPGTALQLSTGLLVLFWIAGLDARASVRRRPIRES